MIKSIKSVIYQYFMMAIGLFRIANPVEPFDEELNDVVERKSYDTRKFTRQDHDVIVQEYTLYKQCKKARGREFKSTLDDVAAKLNKQLGYDKTRHTYSHIWNGSVARESLGERTSV